MENAADALKMAFAVLVFIIAIAIIFVMISKVRNTADIVLYHSDKTNFYQNYKGNNEVDKTADEKGNRIVTITEIISTLYRYYKESVAVTIKLESGDSYYFDLGNETILIKKDEDLLKKLGTEENLEENLGDFISTVLLKSSVKSKTFTEEFTEVPTSGIYSTGSDGSEIVLSAGGKKVYITYTETT